ncbi:MAG TPA: hypothetical protein VMK13_08150 [Streptosporangiaceae bacterium]|nr:hypothetical protein [Streptosporangiaceae bacterium]
MSFTDRLVLWLHVGFVIFAIGPVAVAISSTPRYIRKRDLPVVRYLRRITTIFTIGSVGVLPAGIILARIGNARDLGRPWLTASMTLYVVAVVLLALIIGDQRKAIRALEGPGPGSQAATASPAAGPPAAGPAAPADSAAAAGAGPAQPTTATAAAAGAGAGAGTQPAAVTPAPAPAAPLATVERGRIAMLGAVVNLIWLIILVLMIWNA